MPPLPKRKYPKAAQRKRRSHLHLTPTHTVECPHCSVPRLPHHACPNCGYYKDREAVAMEKPTLNE